ncbi:formylglycine-generating enzyme family protein [Sphingomonas sp. 4RDLI-65]|uniref:formylglycine-generating enzyme family protein n=1 Tax=Sphingomonas sp. 4RDLI-65 TaxID=3111641 RepID=UPI003C2E3ABE
MVPIRDQADHSAGFAMSNREVTWKQYLQSVDQARCPMPQTSLGKNRDALSSTDPRIRDDYPVTGVGAEHVKCYIAWLNHSAKSAYRLPTLSEWQVAARKAQPRLWSSLERAGAAALVRSDPRSSVREATVQTVASGPPSSDGIFDLEGNAGELVSDLHYLSEREAKWCGGSGLSSPLVTGRGGYDVERGSGREIPGEFRSVGHLACGIPMNSVGFRLASSLGRPLVRLRPH